MSEFRMRTVSFEQFKQDLKLNENNEISVGFVKAPILIPEILEETPKGITVLRIYEGPRRIYYPTLLNMGLFKLTPRTTPVQLQQLMDSYPYVLLNFWAAYEYAVIESLKTVKRMSRLTKPYATFAINSFLSRYLQTLDLVKNDLHEDAHRFVWSIGYPANVKFTTIPDNQALEFDIKMKYTQALVEKGVEVVHTPKSHPARKVAFKVSPLFDAAVLLPKCVTLERSPRELYSAFPNSRSFVNDKFTKPIVKNEVEVDFKNHVKFLNCAFLSSESIELGGENPDMVLGTGWLKISDALSALEVQEFVLPFAGETQEEIEQVIKDRSKHNPYVLKIQVDPIREPTAMTITRRITGEEAPLYRVAWNVTSVQEVHCNMTFKVVTPEALKGMVLPIDKLLVEKRPNEDFLRPIFLVFPVEAAKKKKAGLALLRMLASRLKEPIQLDSRTPREELRKLVNEITNKLKEEGDTGKSKIFELKPLAAKGIQAKITKQRVFGFTEQGGKIVECESVGEISAALVPLGEEPVETIAGEMAILRVQEDEQFVVPERVLGETKGISLDPFVTNGKPASGIYPLPSALNQIKMAQDAYNKI